MIYLLLFIIGSCNAISELSNHGKLSHWGQWWSMEAYNNKNTWKPYPLWSIWPFIIFTDAFHFFKAAWVFAMVFAIQIGGVEAWQALLIYSCTFEIVYSLLPYFRVK